MSGLPQISGKDCVKALAKAGFYVKRQQGSHMILRRDDPFVRALRFSTFMNNLARQLRT